MKYFSQIDSIDYNNFEFSSIFTYISMLTRIDSTKSLLINSFYKPPNDINSIYYIKLLTSIGDIMIWKEGLAGFHQPFCRSNSIATPTQLECNFLLFLIISFHQYFNIYFNFLLFILHYI
jgi:hypothetical protein